MEKTKMAATPDLSQNRQAELRITMIFITVLATCFVGLRFYARGLKQVRYGWDDWVILFALVSSYYHHATNVKHRADWSSK